MSGLSPAGFERKRLPDIQQELRAALRDAFGPINTGPESVFGQLIGIFAEREAFLWELAETVYLSQYPASAAGRSLDGVAALTGITRLPAARTTVSAVLLGAPATNVPEGSQARVTATGDRYELLDGVTLAADGPMRQAYVSLTASDNTTYTISINGTPHSHTSGVGDPVATISAALAAEIDSSAAVVATGIGATIEITSVDGLTPFTLTITAGPITLTLVGAPGTFRAVQTGPRLAFAGELNQIETAVSGWSAVNNLVDGVAGRDLETDPELRLRREQSLRIIGAGTVGAIRARLLQQVIGISAVAIVENRTDAVDGDGRPPHSFEAIVVGGADQEIGEVIWVTKPAGIETHGNVNVTVVDSTDVEREVKFSRPVPLYVWVRMDVTIGPNFPNGGAATIADNIAAFGASFQPGQDVIIQQLFTPIYAVPGVLDVSLEIAVVDDTDPPDSGDWVSVNESVGAVEVALWTANRVEVTLV